MAKGTNEIAADHTGLGYCLAITGVKSSPGHEKKPNCCIYDNNQCHSLKVPDKEDISLF